MATPDIQGLISQAASDNNVPVDILKALLTQESSLRPDARNAETGAAGMAQLMPTTARMLGVNNPNDPVQAIPAAAKYLRQGLDANGGDMTQALMYYYGGPDKRLWGPKTQAYPGQVLARLQPPIGASQDPNSYLAPDPAWALQTAKNLLDKGVQNINEHALDILPDPNKSIRDPENMNRMFQLAMGFTGGGLTFGGVGAHPVREGLEALNSVASEDVPYLIAGDRHLRNLQEAQNILYKDLPEDQYNPSREVNKQAWEKTGWFLGPDNRMRFEIPDTDASIIGDPDKLELHGLPQNKAVATPEDSQAVQKINVKYDPQNPVMLEDILDHPKLFDAYPDLKTLQVVPTKGDEALRFSGSMDSANRIITMAPQRPISFLSTLLHEVQHHIQYLEGFARGGSPEEFLMAPVGEAAYTNLLKRRIALWDQLQNEHGLNPQSVNLVIRGLAAGRTPFQFQRDMLDKLPQNIVNELVEIEQGITKYKEQKPLTPEEARQKYMSLAGEVESRNVQERHMNRLQGLPPEFPLETAGYPQGPQIVLRQGQRYQLAPVEHDPWLQPVEHDPWLSPVDHDPFQ